jgi:8-oxo-dGTP pyrophosphatase MutT (NUDIX family)
MKSNKGIGIIVRKDRKLLVGLRTDGKGLSMPGGHVDGLETLRQAAIRELEEETRIIPINLSYLGRVVSFNDDDIWISPVFYVSEFEGTPQNTDEMIAWTWRDPIDILKSKGLQFEPSRQALLAYLTGLWL